MPSLIPKEFPHANCDIEDKGDNGSF